MKVATISAVLLASGAAHSAEAESVQKAQAEMIGRQSREITSFAEKLNAGDDLVDYCRSELDLRTVSYPRNGSPPFGVDYNHMTPDLLRVTIRLREHYETTFIKLCLANAVKVLREAK